jgi:ribosomal-protein-alanine N-acetyltransferase
MVRRDMPRVYEIEKRSYEHPWCDDDFIRCLRQRNTIGMVAEEDGIVVGFMIYESHARHIHVVSFTVDPECRREGIGTAMMDKLKSKLEQFKRNRITLDVRETNLGAQLFFKKQGLEATKVLKDHYDDVTEDAYHMEYSLARASKKEANVDEDAEKRQPQTHAERIKHERQQDSWPGHNSNDFY